MKKNNSTLPSPKTATALLDMYYIEARSFLLETAAILDRIERAEDAQLAMSDERVKNLYQALDVLKKSGGNRAEEFQLLFSEID